MSERTAVDPFDWGSLTAKVAAWTIVFGFVGVFMCLRLTDGQRLWPPLISFRLSNAADPLKWVYLMQLVAAGWRKSIGAKIAWFFGVFVWSLAVEVPCYYVAIHTAKTLGVDIASYFPDKGVPPVVDLMVVGCTALAVWVSYLTSPLRASTRRSCPYCRKKISAEATRCPYCTSVIAD